MHADAIIAIAASRTGERLTRDIFGDDVAWIPWQRPGFDLGLTVGQASQPRGRKGLVLGGHGLLTWGATSRECYVTTLAVIQQAADWLDAHGQREPFGPAPVPLPAAERHRLPAVAPSLRGLVGRLTPKVMTRGIATGARKS
jgi:rhamnose utilization protein RhaD (predicted bifunctional aldolase and dehydrogenase)